MKKTSYQFAVEINNEALDAMERLSVGVRCFLPDNGNIILEAKEKLANMEDWERKHKQSCMNYIVDIVSPGYENIYSFLATEFDPEQLKNLGLINEEECKESLRFLRKMRTLSNRVCRFDAAL